MPGGGGGGGSSRAGSGNAGGAGGGASGQVGYSPYDGKSDYGGNPGTQSAAGADASCVSANTAGGQGPLKGGVVRIHSYGGGGGGGYWGGSAGGYSESNTMGGGGGGSGYFNPTLVSSAALFSGSGTTPGDAENAIRGSSGNAGAIAGSGGSGIVIIRYLTQNASKVAFGGTPATNVKVVNTSTMTATAPAHAGGAVDLVVTNYDGQSDTLINGFTYFPDKYTITSFPSTLRETEEGTFVIQAQDINGNVLTAPEDILLTLSSTSTSGFFAKNVSEDISTRWDYNSVILPAGQSSVTFYYKDNLKGTPIISATAPAIQGSAAANQQIAITSKYRFLVTGITNPIKAGVPSSVTIQAVDFRGFPQHDYTGTIHFTSTAPGTVLPADFTFTTNMLGEHTFVNQVTFITQGIWNLTATDVNDSNITGTQSAIGTTAPNSGTISKLKIITEPQYFAADSHSSAITVEAQDNDGLGIPVTSDTPIYIYSDSPTRKFSLNGETNWVTSYPFTITIKKGASSALFYYKDLTLGAHNIIVREDLGVGPNVGWENDTQIATTGTGDAYKIALTVPAGTVVAGNFSAPFTVALQDDLGNLITSLSNQNVYLSTTSPGGRFSLVGNDSDLTNTKTVTIPAGSTSASFYYRNTIAGVNTITASEAQPANGNVGLRDGTGNITIGAAPVSKLAFTTAPFELIAGATSPRIDIVTQDEFGNSTPVTANTTIYLSTQYPGALFSTSTNFASPITSVVISKSASSRSFYFKQTTNISSQPITISDGNPANGDTGLKDATQNETIIPGAVKKFVVQSANPSGAVVSEIGPFTVSTQNLYGIQIPVIGNTDVYFYTNSTGATREFSLNSGPSWSAVNKGTILDGSGSLTFYYKESKAGTSLITVADDAVAGVDYGITNASVNVAVTAGSYNGIAFSNTPYSVEAGQVAGPFTISAVDAFRNPVVLDAPIDIYIADSGSADGLYATSAGGPFTPKSSWPQYITIPAGASSASFYYKNNSADTPVIQFNAEAGHPPGDGSVWQLLNLSWGAPDHITVRFPAASCPAQSACQVELAIVNARGIPVRTTSPVVMNLVTTNPLSGRFDTAPDGPFDGSVTSVTFQSGQNEYGMATLWYKDTKAGNGTVTGSAGGITPGSGTFSITANPEMSGLAITTSPQTLQTGQKSAPITVQILDPFGNYATSATGVTINLASTSGSGIFLDASGQVITSITISGETGNGTFCYKDTRAGNPVLTVTGGGYSASQTETINYGVATKFSISAPNNSLVAGTPSAVLSVNALNAYGEPVPATSDLPVSLTHSSLTGRFDTGPAGSFTGAVNSVTIPGGQSSVNFCYKETTGGAATITASKTGYTSGSFTFNVAAAEIAKLAFTTPQRTTAAGAPSAIFTVQLQDIYGNSRVTDHEITLSLSTSDAGHSAFAASASGPWTLSTVTVNAGAGAAGFCYRDTEAGTKTITATADGLTPASQQAIISGGAVHHFVLTTDPLTLITQNAGQVTIQAADQYGNPTVAGSNTAISLSSTSSRYQFSALAAPWTNTAQVILNAGQGTKTVWYKDWKAGNPTISVTTSYGTITQQETILPGSVAKIVFGTNPQTIITNTPSQPLRFYLADLNGNQTNASADTTVTVTSSLATGTFSFNGTDDWQPGLNITVAAGESLKTFYYRDSAEGKPVITLSAPAITPAQQTETVIAGLAAKMVIIAEATAVAGDSVWVTLQAQTAGGLPASVTSPLTVSLSTSAAAGTYSLASAPWIPVTSVTIPAMQCQVTLCYTQTAAGETSLNVTDLPQEWVSPGKTILFSAADFYKLAFTARPDAVAAGQGSAAFTVSPHDRYGNAVMLTGDLAGYLYGSPTGVFATNNAGPWDVTAVTIPAGSNNATTFYYKDPMPGNKMITVSDQPIPDSPDTGIINAEAQITVTGEPATKLRITSSPYSVVAGNYTGLITVEAQQNDGKPAILGASARISLASDPLSGVFKLTPDNGSEAITAVTIPVGASAASFYYRGTIRGTATITVSAQGLTSDSQQVTVDAAAPSRLAFITPAQTRQAGEESLLMQVQLQDAYTNAIIATGEIALSLTSSAPSGSFSLTGGAGWTGTTTATIAAGSDKVAFYYKDTVSGNPTLTADETANQGFEAALQTYTVSAAAMTRLSFTSLPQTLIAGQPSAAMTVTAYDRFGNTKIADQAILLYLYGSKTGGIFSTSDQFTSATGTITMQSGSATATFYYKDNLPGNADITVSDQPLPDDPDTGIVNAKQSLAISRGTPARIAFTNSSGPLTAGQGKALVITLQNLYGIPVSAVTPQPVYLFSSSPSGRYSLSNSFNPGDMVTGTIIGAGSDNTTVYYADNTAAAVSLTASDSPLNPEVPDLGLINGSLAADVVAADLFSFCFITPEQALSAGQPSERITLQARDQFGNTKSADHDVTLFFRSDSPTLRFSADASFTSTTAGALLAAGTSSLSVYARDVTVGTHTLTASDKATADNPDSGILNAHQNISISAGNITGLVFQADLPETIAGGSSAAITVATQNRYGVNTPVLQNTTLYLFSASPQGKFAAAEAGPWSINTLTIPAGQATATFYYRDGVTGNPAITVSDAADPVPDLAWTNAAATISIIPGEITQLAIVTAPQTIIARHSSQIIRIQTQNRYGNPTAVSAATPIYLRSTSDQSEFSTAAQPGQWGISYITMPAGQHTAEIYYHDSRAGSPTITATDNLPPVPDTKWTNVFAAAEYHATKHRPLPGRKYLRPAGAGQPELPGYPGTGQ